jgi:hypothetical protein
MTELLFALALLGTLIFLAAKWKMRAHSATQQKHGGDAA